MGSPLKDPKLEGLLDRLHRASQEQEGAIAGYLARRSADGSLDGRRFDDAAHAFLADKMVSLEADKAQLCYLLCRSIRARRVVEAGTSFGVSTLYLAAAVRDNGADDGIVIGTEYEPAKARAARENFKEAGLEDWIELREGDLRTTLQSLPGPVDFLLLDIWEVALDALRLVHPHLRSGALIVCDNTAVHAEHYRELFGFVNDPANGLRTLTLPFSGGLELTVRD